MGELFTHKNMVETLSIRREISLTDSELFFNELCNIIAETLSCGESLTIDGLGTFSLSVATNSEDNENTITNTYKITFIPDPILADKSNTPFSHFQRTPLNKGVDFDFIKRVTSLEEESNEFYSEEYIIEEKKESSTIIYESEKDTLEERLQQEISESENLEVEREDEIINTTNISTENPTEKNEEEISRELFEKEVKTIPLKPLNKKTSKKGKKRRVIITSISILIIIFSSAKYYKNIYKSDESIVTQENANSRNVTTISSDNAEKEIISNLEKRTEEDSIIAQNSTEINNENADKRTTVQNNISENKRAEDDTPESVVIESGKTLRLIALDKYGDRNFWVYIYLENKNKIKNPNIVPAGITVTIPPKSKYAINANDTTSINKAKELGIKAEKGEI